MLDWLRGSPSLPTSAREYVSGSSITVGLKFAQGATIIDLGSGLPKELIPTLNTMISDTLGKAGLHLVWTSLQMNLNTVANWHQYWGNIGPSAIGALGSYQGGGFQIQGHPELDINRKLVASDGRNKHRSLPSRGRGFPLWPFDTPGSSTATAR